MLFACGTACSSSELIQQPTETCSKMPCKGLPIKPPPVCAGFVGDTFSSFRHRPFSLASACSLYLKHHLLLFPGNKAVVCRLFFHLFSQHTLCTESMICRHYWIYFHDISSFQAKSRKIIHYYCNKEDFFHLLAIIKYHSPSLKTK